MFRAPDGPDDDGACGEEQGDHCLVRRSHRGSHRYLRFERKVVLSGTKPDIRFLMQNIRFLCLLSVFICRISGMLDIMYSAYEVIAHHFRSLYNVRNNEFNSNT